MKLRTLLCQSLATQIRIYRKAEGNGHFQDQCAKMNPAESLQ